jgi:hypothetical protein
LKGTVLKMLQNEQSSLYSKSSVFFWTHLLLLKHSLNVAYSKNEPFHFLNWRMVLQLATKIYSKKHSHNEYVFSFHSCQTKEVFCVLQNTTLAVKPTQPGNLSLGVKHLGCEADHSSPSSAQFSTHSFSRT